MKKIIFLTLMVFSTLSLNAQRGGTAPLSKGQLQLNFGGGFSNWGIPVYASLDISVHKDVTIAPELSFGFGSYQALTIGFGADYHWNYLLGIPSNWDFYAGIGVGYHVWNNDDNNYYSYNPLRLGARVGGRWYWSENWALNLELGGGTGFGGKFGVSVKL
jgi:outer membrane immunogenic protein